MTLQATAPSFVDRIVSHALFMAPFSWLVAAGAATFGSILPSIAARRVLGYGLLPYDFGDTFSRSARSSAALPYLLAIVLGGALICVIRENRAVPWSLRGLIGRLFAWTFIVQYLAQGYWYFGPQPEGIVAWGAALVVTLIATTLYVAAFLLTLPARTKLCSFLTR